MSPDSPLNPREHSIFHTFKRSRWVYSKFLIYRIPIIMIFLAWVSFACYLKALDLISKELVTSSFSLMLLNQMMIPLHTLLICGCGIDRLYLSHLLLTGIFEFVFAVMFTFTWPHILIIPVVACQFMAYVYWYIPTRILYFKTFNLARAFFNVPANTLLRKLVVPWAILCTICSCIIACLFVLAFKYRKLIPGKLATQAFGCVCTGSMMLFELYMYSKINPLKNQFTCFSSWKEMIYILVAIAAILIGITEVIVIKAKRNPTVVHSLLHRIVARIIQICRYIILWSYCVDELKYDSQGSESTVEINIRDVRVNLSKLSEKEVRALEIK